MVVHLERIVAWKIRHHELRAHLEFGSRGYVQRARLEVSRVQVETKASIAVSRRLATSVVDGARALRARLVDEIPELLLEERAVRENFDHRRGTRVGRDALVAFVTRQRQREARVRSALREDEEVRAERRPRRFRGRDRGGGFVSSLLHTRRTERVRGRRRCPVPRGPRGPRGPRFPSPPCRRCRPTPR